MLKSHRKTIFEALGRNPIHPFPARMAPGIALDALSESRTSLRVLDPMVGSGTVLAVARAKGHKAIGFDIDPLAVLLAGVWTRTVDPEAVNHTAAEVLGHAKSLYDSLTPGQAYPDGSDIETRKFIRYWFDESARRQLTALSRAIGMVRDDVNRDTLWCGFSRLIITKSAGASLAMDVSHSRPHREFSRAPVKPFQKFIIAVQSVVSNCLHHGRDPKLPTARIRRGDARELGVCSNSIDLILTSPPYLNAIDYMRCSKFSLIWMGYKIEEIRRIRGDSIGAESAIQEALEAEWVNSLIRDLRMKPTLSRRDYSMLARYVWDMGKALSESYRVLRRGGRAVYVVGDSKIRGTFIRNSRVVSAVAQRAGLSQRAMHSRSLPANRRYLPPPKMGPKFDPFDVRMRREVVLVFEKPAL